MRRTQTSADGEKKKRLWDKKVRPQEEEQEEVVGDWQVQFLLDRVWFSSLLTVDKVKG